jgi:Fic family protein
MFRAEPEGFLGGMSAEKYRALAGASPATASRDLSDLIRLGALVRVGERRGTRYQLAMGPKQST